MRLLVVEDDSSIAEGLKRALGREGHVVDLSPDGHSALQAIGEVDYDCVVLDLGLPDIDGTQVLRHMRHQNQQTPVIIISAREETSDRVLGLDLGADDYLPKPFELDELEARIRAVTRRAFARRGDDIMLGKLRFSLNSRQVFVNGKAADLLPREFAVLECLVLRHGRVVSKRRLLEQITSWDAEISENAIETYVHRLRRKIENSGCTIRTLRGFGYLLEVEGAD